MALYVPRSNGLLVDAATVYNPDHAMHDTNLIAANSSRVRGLKGGNNAATPLTQFDLQADAVFLQSANATQLPLARAQTTPLTNNILTAGPARNGRDQSAAFSANSWIHFYFIWNGTSMASLSSAVAPPTGPTLPSGDLLWTYAGAGRLNASTQLLRIYFAGAAALYGIPRTTARVLDTGQATTFTNIDCSGLIPPNARRFQAFCALRKTLTEAGSEDFIIYFRPDGSTEAEPVTAIDHSFVAISTPEYTTAIFEFPNINQIIEYQVVNVSGTLAVGNGVFVEVLGYTMSNGDS